MHFPIALAIFSFVADLLGHLRNNTALRAAGFWSLVGACVGVALAVPAGYYDMSRAALGETHEYVHFHLRVGWVLAASVAALTLWRWFIYAKPVRRAGRVYLAAAFLVTGLTFFQGWFGGEMVYSRGAGVAAAGRGTEPESAGDKRLDAVMETFGAGHGGGAGRGEQGGRGGASGEKSGERHGDHPH